MCFRYEGRCGLPTNFDATYCYALGYGAGSLLQSGKTGLISSVKKNFSSFLENNHRIFHYFKITYIYHLCFSFAGWELGCSCWEMDSWWYTVNFIDGCWEKTWYCSILFLKSSIVLFVIALIFMLQVNSSLLSRKLWLSLKVKSFSSKLYRTRLLYLTLLVNIQAHRLRNLRHSVKNGLWRIDTLVLVCSHTHDSA